MLQTACFAVWRPNPSQPNTKRGHRHAPTADHIPHGPRRYQSGARESACQADHFSDRAFASAFVRFAPHALGAAVLAKADEPGVAQMIIACPLHEFELPDKHGSDPAAALVIAKRWRFVPVGSRGTMKACASLTRDEIGSALDRLEAGLQSYLWPQRRVGLCDVSTDAQFQTRFDAFYRVRRNSSWRAQYFSLMESSKGMGIEFPQGRNEINRRTGRLEASFASKLVATLNPSAPVIDRFVRQNLAWSPYACGDELVIPMA